jgi:phasin family protein
MFNFTQQSMSPAVKAQVNAQFSFFSDMAKNMFESVQKVNELNIQVAATVMDESLSSARQLLSATDRNDALSIVAGQSQPAADKVRAYQQHLQNIFAEARVGMAKTVEAHVPESTRTAEAVVRELAQRASEETSKVTQRQKENFEKLTASVKDGSDRIVQGNIVKATH